MMKPDAFALYESELRQQVVRTFNMKFGVLLNAKATKLEPHKFCGHNGIGNGGKIKVGKYKVCRDCGMPVAWTDMNPFTMSYALGKYDSKNVIDTWTDMLKVFDPEVLANYYLSKFVYDEYTTDVTKEAK